MTQPLGDHRHGHAPKVQRRAARVAGIMQPDRANTGRRRQPGHMFVNAPGVYGPPASLHAM